MSVGGWGGQGRKSCFSCPLTFCRLALKRGCVSVGFAPARSLVEDFFLGRDLRGGEGLDCVQGVGCGGGVEKRSKNL